MYHFSNSLLKNTLHSLTKKSNHTSKKRRNFGLILFFTWNSSTRGVGYVQHWGLFLAVAAADVVLVVLVELDQRTHSPGGDSTDAVVGLGHQHHHRRAPVFFQVGKFLPQKGCLWVYLFHLRQVTRTQALDGAVSTSVIIKVSGLAGARSGGRVFQVNLRIVMIVWKLSGPSSQNSRHLSQITTVKGCVKSFVFVCVGTIC